MGVVQRSGKSVTGLAEVENLDIRRNLIIEGNWISHFINLFFFYMIISIFNLILLASVKLENLVNYKIQ